ncbi:MAG: protein kinase [Deltaproteobacteria bacterium]|nr:protein kinase [Deltaproteobacteria bacterium]
MSTTCPRCGADFKETASFCGFCGAPALRESRKEPADALLGRIIDGRYRVVTRIGEGGMGTVYKVEHVHIGKFMALKILRREFSASADVVRRFRREAQAASRLSNVHTVAVFDFGRSAEGALYIAMEWVEGENLLTLLSKEGPFPWRRVAKIGLQLAISLSEAHEKGIVHRDLKPENIMVVRTKEGGEFVKILDFGLAKVVELDSQGEVITAHGNIVGTPYYMAPEQIKGDDVDPRADIYSLGAVLYRLLCGDPPFYAKSPIAVLQKHLNEPLPPLRDRMSGRELPDALEALVHQALEKDRDRRPGNAEELRRRFDTLLANSGHESPSGSKSPVVALDEWRWDTELRISERQDWERFARGLKRRRFLSIVIPLVLLGGIAATLYFFATEQGWFARSREGEPNNDPNQATRLVPGRPLKGQIGKRTSPAVGDQDFYRVEFPKGAAPQNIRVEVTPIPRMNIEIKLFSASGGAAMALADETGPGGREIMCRHQLPPEGALILVRERPLPDSAPTENVSDDYTITATLSAISPGEEVEPNNSAQTANALAPTTWITGTICGGSDEDWYRVDATPLVGKTVRLEFEPKAGAEKATVGFYSEELAFLGEKRELKMERAGVYYVVVRGSKGTAFEAEYRLRAILK